MTQWDHVSNMWRAIKSAEKFVIALSADPVVVDAKYTDQVVVERLVRALVEANAHVHHLLYDTELGLKMKEIK